MSTLENEFIEALFNSVNYRNAFSDYDPPYFSDRYGDIIKAYFDSVDKKSKELSKKEGAKYPICALASSGRWAFLKYSEKGNNTRCLEVPLKNDIKGKRGPTYMDVVRGNTYIECKCQEITRRTPIEFSGAYSSSKLFESFEFRKFDDECTKPIVLTPEEVGIHVPYRNKRSNKLRFDVKQLICHLIAIANTEDSNPELKYVIFKPNDDEIRKHDKVRAMYEELNEEIDAIWNPNSKIMKFCNHKDHIIRLSRPEPICVSDVEDFILYKL